jgi:signal transduction histidine kinase
VNALGWTSITVFLFLLRTSDRALPKLEKGLLAGGVLVTIATSPLVASALLAPTMLPLVYGVTWLLQVVLAVIGGWAAWRSGSRTAWAVAFIYGLISIAGVHDLRLHSYLADPEGVYLLPHTVIGLLAISMAIICRHYIDSLRMAENANIELGRRIAEREVELSESYRQLRHLEQEHALAQERQRITREMHDGMGSSLITALRLVEHGAVGRGEIAQMLRDCIDELKLSIDSLSIAGPDLLALLATLRFRLEPRLQAAGIALTWNIVDVPPLPWLDAQAALHILRILQEVLANIIKHTKASRIVFATSSDERSVLVEVRDNGGGSFTYKPGGDVSAEGAPLNGGKGLANIVSRATALGAACAWEPTDEGGVFTLRLPRAQGA